MEKYVHGVANPRIEDGQKTEQKTPAVVLSQTPYNTRTGNDLVRYKSHVTLSLSPRDHTSNLVRPVTKCLVNDVD